MSTEEKAYYYRSYESHCIRKVSMSREDTDSEKLLRFPFEVSEHIIEEN